MEGKTVKERISAGKITLGTWIQLPDVFTTEIIAQSGFDWLAIDLEHGLIDLEHAFSLIQIIDRAGVVPLVRLQTNDDVTIRRVLDAGAKGVIVPMVNSPEDARRIVDAVKYPPMGKRSFGLGRASRFGVTFEEYLRTHNEKSIIVAQIEHISALENLDQILAVPGLDAIIIGPYDLSGSLGIPGQFNDPRFQKVISEITRRVKKAGISLGMHIVHPTQQELDERIAEGFTFIGFGMDTIFMQEGAMNAVRCLTDRRKKK